MRYSPSKPCIRAIEDLPGQRDPFAFLEDRDAPQTKAWLAAEEERKLKFFDKLQPLQRQLFNEMQSFLEEEKVSAEYAIGPYVYYERFEKGKEFALHLRRKKGEEQLVFDPNALSKSGLSHRPGSLVISPDSEWVLFTVDKKGTMSYSLGVRHIESGKILEDCLDGITPEVVWSGNSESFYYTALDPKTLRPWRIFLHRIGTDTTQDCLVYEEEDPSFHCYVRKTRDQRFLLIHSNSPECDEIRFLPVSKGADAFSVFCSRSERIKYSLQYHRNAFFIHTNYQAPNYRLMVAPPEPALPSQWKEVASPKKNHLLCDFRILGSYLVLSEKLDGLMHFRIHHLETGKEHAIRFSEPAYSARISENTTFHPPVLGIEYTSLNTPKTTLAYDLNRRELTKVRVPKLPNLDPKNYRVERIEAPTRDGLSVLMTLAYRPEWLRRGPAPTLVYGYGAYGLTVPIEFKPQIIALLDRGFVYAIVHVRGGGSRGSIWYSAGKRMHKKNSFFDYLDGTQHLVNHAYSDPENLFAMGESAGGLLVAAALNLAPGRFKGAILKVPFVDVLGAMSNPSLPLTLSEYNEWGPIEEKSVLDYIRSYSPYQNIRAQPYPHLLVTTGMKDTRVPFWQACKWVARLRALKTDHRELVLDFAKEMGHQGPNGRYQSLWCAARETAFLLHLAGRTRHARHRT